MELALENMFHKEFHILLPNQEYCKLTLSLHNPWKKIRNEKYVYLYE